MDDEHAGWTDEDDAHLALEALPAWHPALFVDVFRTGLRQQTAERNRLLAAAFVTPESVDSWGDFFRARAAFAELKISMTALYVTVAPDVAYIRLVETDQHINPRIEQVPATMPGREAGHR